MLLIFWLSSSSDAQGIGGLLSFLPYRDKFAHAAIFGILAVFLRLSGLSYWQAVLASSLYGVSDELHQYFVQGRASDVFDWMADTIGAAIVLALLSSLSVFKRLIK